MQTGVSFLNQIRQNDKLPIRIISPEFGHLTPAEAKAYVAPHRTPYYFFMFMIDGQGHHQIDLQQYEVSGNELIFVTPHQIHKQDAVTKGSKFVKLGFDECCLSLLPRQYPFLLDPLNHSKVNFKIAAAKRIKAILAMLLDLLKQWHTEVELILAHLNSLLSEVNAAYFLTAGCPIHDKIASFTTFKTYIDDHLTEQHNVSQIARELGINPNGLYKLVKRYSGLSPKEYITNRLILEAQRRLYYGENSSIKELAFELGFNDPEYFSRLFRKVSGQTIAKFLQDLSGK